MSLTYKRFPGKNQGHPGDKRHDDVENNIERDAVLPGNPGIQHKPDPQPHCQAVPGPFLALPEGDVGDECQEDAPPSNGRAPDAVEPILEGGHTLREGSGTPKDRINLSVE